MSGWAAFWTVLAGVLGGLLGAGATLRATTRTLRQQATLSAGERALAAEDAFEGTVRRTDQQMLSCKMLLETIERPEAPFFELGYDSLETLLTFAQVPDRVAYELERFASMARSYNAAAQWGNRKHPMSGSSEPAEVRWREARGLVGVAFTEYAAWRGQTLPRDRTSTT